MISTRMLDKKLTNVLSVLFNSGISQALGETEELGTSSITVSASLSVSWTNIHIIKYIFIQQCSISD